MPASDWLTAGRTWIRSRITGPLLLALLLSLCVHLGVLSRFDWSLGGDDAAPPVIEARLQAPPPSVPSPVPSVAPQPVRPVSKPRPAAPAPVSPATPAQPAAVEEVAMPPVPAALAESVAAASTAAASSAAAEDAALAIEPSADTDAEEDTLPVPYQHVDTRFDVYVDGEKRPSGNASIQYHAEAGRYQLRWEIQGNGLLKLLYPKLLQESEGEIGEQGLRPLHYRYAFGQKADKTYEANFNWTDRTVTLKTSKGELREDLPLNTQDLLSFMYQFMFVPPLREMRVALTNGKRIGHYEYSFEGEESMDIAGQSLTVVHIAHSRGDTDEKVDVWLATEYRFLPVKIRKTEKNGRIIEQLATQLTAN